MAGAYTVTISAKDLASGVFDSANKRVEAFNKRIAEASAPARRFAQTLDTFSKVTGLTEIATGFSSIGRAGTEAFRSLSRIVEPLAAIVGVASLAGVYRLTQAWGDFASALGNQAQRAGASASQLYVLQNAARLAGVDAETLTGGITTLNDNLRNAAFGGAPAFLNVLANLGISFEDLQRQNPEQRLKTLADALAKVKSPTDRALFTKELLGGEGMIPFLNKGAAGISAWDEAARKLAGDAPSVADGQAFRQAQVGLAESIMGIGNAIAGTLGPALTPVLADVSGMAVHMREWLDANKEWLQHSINDEVGKFVGWLKAVDWNAVGGDMREIAAKAQAVADALGGWERVGEAVVIFIAGSWFLRMAAPFAKLGVAVAELTFAIGTTLVKAGFAVAGDAAVAFEAKALSALAVAGKVLGAAGQLGLLGVVAHEGLTAVDPGDSAGTWIDRTIPGAGALDDWFARHFGVGRTYDEQRQANQQLGAVRPLAPGQQSENARAMADVFAGMGFTREATGAMLGSGIQESGLNPHSGAGTAHQGIFQWDEVRRSEIERHFGKPVTSMTPAEQARAAGWELEHNPAFAGLNADLHSSHDLPKLNDGVTRGFEAPGNYDTEVPRRLGRSQGALGALGPAVALPSAAGAGVNGVPGATGRVDLNVRVLSETPTAVTGRSAGGVDLHVATPGLLGAQ